MPIHPATPHAIRDAAAALRRGELVAFPTETVYGLGANALDAQAVARVYAAKGRPAWNPLIVHVADVDTARTLARHWPAGATRLAAACWPGPLTLVLPKAPHVPDTATAGRDAVGIRIPDHPVALALLREAGVPVVAPSANRFTQVSPTTAAHVQGALGNRVSHILDGGPCQVGIESTVLDLTQDPPVVLRPGMVSADALADILGVQVLEKSAVLQHDKDTHESPVAPGQADRHYAPHADVWLMEPGQEGEVTAALAARPAGSGGVTLLLCGDDPPLDTTATAPALLRVDRLPADPAGYARGLYAALHAADAAGSAVLVIACPPATPPWRGVRDRLARAAR
jgi:L-threonylcarbamoyladenylate synthase